MYGVSCMMYFIRVELKSISPSQDSVTANVEHGVLQKSLLFSGFILKEYTFNNPASIYCRRYRYSNDYRKKERKCRAKHINWLMIKFKGRFAKFASEKLAFKLKNTLFVQLSQPCSQSLMFSTSKKDSRCGTEQRQRWLKIPVF